jgi:tetratricopeptide (TPR) repeat protein/DNA-binding winged helix-turn-helix (wHTH) protein
MSENNAASAQVLRLGDDFELDLGAYELRKKGQGQRLGRIPMELLLLLIEQRGQLVTREKIIDRVWGKDVFLDTDNSINAAIRKIRQVLEDDAEAPRYVQTLIGRGYRFVGEITHIPGLESRRGSAKDALQTEREAHVPCSDLAGSGSIPATVVPANSPDTPEVPSRVAPRPQVSGAVLSRKQPFLRSRALLAAGLMLTLILAGTVGGVRDRLFHPPSVKASRPLTVRPSIAVLEFKNLSRREEEAWLSTALSEMLDAELASGQKVRVVAGENVARMKMDLALPASDAYAADTLLKIRRNLGSDMVVVGSYLTLGKEAHDKIRVNLQLQDARSGETIAAVSEDGTQDNLPELVSRTGDQVRRILQIGDVAPGEARQLRAALPQNTEAARLYAEGLVRLRGFDVLGARDSFQQAVAADPNHALSHAALSECWWSLGVDAKAREEGEKALALSANLSREDQLSVEARYRWSAHQWQRAVEVYKTLWEVFPDNLDYGVNLARVEAQAGMGKEAMATVDELASNPLSATDPRVDLAEASAADRLGDLQREEHAAARAAEKGNQTGTRILTGRALMTQGSALSALGDNDRAVAALNQAQTIFSEVGDRQGLARVLNNLSIIERHEGKLAEAEKNIGRALEIFQKSGSKQGAVMAFNNLSNVYWEQGRIAKATEAEQESLKLSRELNDKLHEATAVGNIGGLLELQGKLGEARQYFEESLRLNQEMENKEGVGLVLGNMADLLTRQGDLATARRFAEDAQKADQECGAKSLQGYASFQLAEVLEAQGDLAGAETKFQESARIRHEIQETATEAESRLAMGRLQLEKQGAKAAEESARAAIAEFPKAKSADNAAMGYSLLALALSRQGKYSEAQQFLRVSRNLLPATVDPAARLQVESDGAFVAGLSSLGAGKPPAGNEMGRALKDMESVREKARTLGYAGIELETRLREGELEMQAGRTESGRAHLSTLQRDARAKGFVSVAEQAGATANLVAR